MADIACDYCQMPTCRCCRSCGDFPCACDSGDTSSAAFTEKRDVFQVAEDWLHGMRDLYVAENMFGPQKTTKAERAQFAVYKTFRDLFK